jgi:hypothetical protein
MTAATKNPLGQEGASDNSTPDFSSLASQFERDFSVEDRVREARNLGVSPEVFELYCVGYDRERGCLVIPERDSDLQVIGLNRRHPDGAKRACPQSRRGLIIPRSTEGLRYVSRISPAILTEGPTDALAAASAGFFAIGRSSATFADYLEPLLRDMPVAIAADNDDAGRRGAEKAAAAIHGSASMVKIVSPPEPYKDCRDWLRGVGAERFRQELLEKIAEAEEYQPPAAAQPSATPTISQGEEPQPVLICLASVERRPVDWLWPGKIAVGKLSMLVGDPGLGKSLVTMDLAARVSCGGALPDDPDQKFRSGGVVIVSAEVDLHDTIGPRLDAAGADSTRVNAITTIKLPNGRLDLFSLRYIAALEHAITQTADCRLVILDPISAFLGDIDSHKNSEVRALLAELAEVAMRKMVAIIVVSHLNKSAGPAIYRTTGSLAFPAASRAAFAVVKDPDDPTGQRRLLLPIKINNGPDQAGLEFVITADADGTPLIAWDPTPVAVDIQRVFGATFNPEGRESRSTLEAAMDWLHGLLANGPLRAKEAYDRAKDERIAERTLERAKRELGVKSFKGDGGLWMWALNQGRQASPSHELGDVGDVGDLGPGGPENAVFRPTPNVKIAKVAKVGDLATFGGRGAGDVVPGRDNGRVEVVV